MHRTSQTNEQAKLNCNVTEVKGETSRSCECHADEWSTISHICHVRRFAFAHHYQHSHSVNTILHLPASLWPHYICQLSHWHTTATSINYNCIMVESSTLNRVPLSRQQKITDFSTWNCRQYMSNKCTFVNKNSPRISRMKKELQYEWSRGKSQYCFA